ncbi:Afadin and alpha-actinin-binding-domain-containing protein [Sphaerosporella brunnea]|uniref:Afadin and alpha-actinin-binding-domain-containing protein n=1 Tax=Sphaerosporella brunnea TaxID=1250544 RepID=A0A5J5EVK8_9PEZI|nr:Afadin and alpha-actinin-binding-domain-containing protein [Sphaerosporella brunnea]
MDPRDLKSASNYVNNQLASRGLVRGTPIDFARPSKDPENPARIINLVYELVQRRDRDAEQRESLAITIRTLRNSETKNNSTIESLNQRIAELERKHSIQEAQCRATASSLRAAESSAKSLRDETVRLKTHLAQVRTQCQNDIRKRDIELQKMKDRLLDSRRGNRPSASTIVVKGGPLSKGSVRGAEEGDAIQGNGLADDTADFLTQLSQALADENDSILALFRQCLSQLKALQGLPDDGHNPETEEEAEDAVNQVVAPPANFDSISREMEAVMSSLNEMINQPNYVPIEELAAKNEELAEKDDEIQLLQKRNDVLEAEWRKAIALMDETNRKLLESIKEPEQLQDSAESAEETEVSHRRQSRGNAGASRPRIAIVAELQVLRDHEAATGETPLRLRSWESERQPRAVPEPETQATQASEPEAVFEPQPLFATQPVVEEPQSEEAQEATQLPESETEVRKTRSKKATPKRRVSTRTRLPEAESEPAPQPGPEHAALTSAAPAETPKRRGNLRKRPEPEPEADCEPAPEPKSVPAATKATPKRRGNAIRTTEPEPEPEPMPEPGTEQDAVPPPIRVNPKRHVVSKNALVKQSRSKRLRLHR